MTGSDSLVSRSARADMIVPTPERSTGPARGMRAGIVLLLALCLCGAFAGAAQAASLPSNYLTVIDQGGANDVNASQVDLTQFGRDDSDPTTYKLLWSWD